MKRDCLLSIFSGSNYFRSTKHSSKTTIRRNSRMLTKRMSSLNFESPVNKLQLSLRIMSGSSQQRNYLEELPQELFVHIISGLSLSAVGNLSLTGSSIIKDRIIDWIMSRSFQKKISSLLDMSAQSLVTEDGLESWRKVTSEFGLLTKKLSMLHGTSYRLRLLSAWYGRLEALVLSENEEATWFRFLGSVGLASALDSFTLGWDEVEYNRILGWLREDFGGDQTRLLRQYLWQYVRSDQSRGSWTAWILNTFTANGFEAARLLMCLFGPAHINFPPPDHVQMSSYQQRVLNTALGRPDYHSLQIFHSNTFRHAELRFADLGKSLSFLLSSHSVSQNYVLTVLNSLFNHFMIEVDSRGEFQNLLHRYMSNFSFPAACLLFSSKKLIKIYLNHLAVQENQTGDYRQLAKVLVSLTVTCDRIENTLDQGLEKILRFALNIPGKDNRTRLLKAFLKELRRRMELEQVSVDTISQLGVFASM